MRKKCAWFILVLLVLSVTGCETLPKKFIRKKKEPDHKPSVVYLEEGQYQKKYSNEYYYKSHYTMWKTWQDDVINNLNGNSKKLKRSAEESYGQLEQMSRYLKPEKKAQLMPLVEQLHGFMLKFQSANYSKGEASSMKSELEKIKRLVANDFYYDKVKNDLLEDSVQL